MKCWAAFCCAMLGMTATAWSDTRTPAEKTVQRDDEDEEADSFHWDDGLWFNKPRFRMKIGGDGQLEAAGFLDGGPEDELENGIQWRRARVYASLRFLERWGFMFQWDFVASDPPELKDAFLEFDLSRIPMTVRGGRFTSTFGLENDGSADDTVFMEQGLTSTFVPPQETGVLVHSQSSRRRWDLGFTSGATGIQCLVCDVAGLVGRYSTALALGEKRILHLGSDISRRWTDEGARFRSRPESHIAPFFVDTELMEDAERVDTALFEVAFLDGPLSVQSEFGFARTKLSDAADPTFTAIYIFASYALTGEARRYDESRGTIGRIQADRELGDDGYGAFELAFRVSHIDLNDADIVGGELTDYSVALNWYPNHRTRVMFNIVRAHRKGVTPAWVFQLRFQLAF